MNHSLKKTVSAIVAFVLSASCFANMAFADSMFTITEPTITNDGNISAITVDGGVSGVAGKGIVAVYSATGILKDVAFTAENITESGSFKLAKEVAYKPDAGDTYRLFVWEVDKDNKLTSKPLANVAKSTPITTDEPSTSPSTKPSASPSTSPSTKPSASPSTSPSTKPSDKPSASPSIKPSASPSVKPSASPSVKPSASPSVKPSASPSVKPLASPSVNPSASPSIKPSDNPPASPSAVPEYTVTGTVDEGVEKVTLTGTKEGNTTVKEGTISGTTVKFEGLIADTYTVTATAKTGYKNATATPAEITITDADITNLSVTTTKAISVTGTVDAGVKSVTLTDKEDSAKKYTGAITGTTVTFADVADGTYTISAEINNGYKDLVIKVADTAATEVTVSGADVTNLSVTTTDTAVYRENVTSLTTGQVTTKESSTDASKIPEHSVADFGSATTPIAALDGWGYMHYGYKDGLTEARQSHGSVDAEKNAVLANGVGTSGCNATVSFIPANAEINLPTAGEIIYTFDAILTGSTHWSTSSGEDRDAYATVGITSAADGKTVTDVANVHVSGTEAKVVKMVFTYSVDKKYYVLEADGETVASGISEAAPTGIYAQAGARYYGIGIANLVVTTAENSYHPVKLTAPAESDGTAEIDKAVAKKDDVVTVTTTAAAGKKVSAVKVNNGDVAVTPLTGDDAGKYTFNMPDGEATVTVEYATADVASIKFNKYPTTVSTGTNNNTFSADAYAADGTKIDDANIQYTITVSGSSGGTLDTNTKIDISSGILTVPQNQTAIKITVTATSGNISISVDVEITTSASYAITYVSELTGGSIVTENKPSTAVENQDIIVEPKPDMGYKCTGVTYTAKDNTTANAALISEGENKGCYSFKMPAANTTVSAKFEKIDYAITNATAADANGTITVNQKANYQDDVEVTVTPAEGYDLESLKFKGTDSSSTLQETDITKNDSDKYVFKMPAEAVTVTATFQKKAVVRPVVDDVEVLSTYDTTAVTLGNRNVIQAPTGNYDFDTINAAKNIVTYDADFLVSDNEELQITFGAKKSNGFGGQSSTLIITGADNSITMKGQNGGSSYTGLSWTENKAPTLTSGKWYRLTVTTKSNGTGWEGATVAVYEVDATTCAIGNKLAEGTLTFRTGTNNTEWNRIQYGVTGTPSIDNVYVYTPAKYESTVTVIANNQPVEGVTVTLNDLAGSTATTDSSGKATFNVPAGEYTATVNKYGYTPPQTAPTLTVAKDETDNALSVEMTAQTSKDITFKITNDENAAVVVKYGDTIIESKAENGKAYALFVGNTYTYTVTPSAENTNKFDPKTDVSLEVTDQTQAEQSVTLDEKTYSVKVANVPGTATVSYSTDNGSNYTKAGTTGNIGQLLTEGEIVASGIKSGDTVKIKFEKDGYNEKVVDVTINGADGVADAAGWTPTDTNLLFSETFTTLKTGEAFGSWYYHMDSKRGNGVQPQSNNAEPLKIGVPIFNDNEYIFSTSWGHFSSCNKTGHTINYTFSDQNGKVIASAVFKITTKWEVDTENSYLYIGEVSDDNNTKTKLSGWATNNAANDLSIKVNKSTGAVVVTLTPTEGTATTVSGTVSGAGVINTIGATDGNDTRIKLSYFKHSKVTTEPTTE